MKYPIPAFLILLMVAASCAGPSTPPPSPEQGETASVYYWKTVFRLDSAARSFIGRHGIHRVYLRMFDVSENKYAASEDEAAVPDASVRVDGPEYDLLKDSLSYMEFVPVVYVTLDALKAMRGNEGILARNIVTRVSNMCAYDGLPNVGELQLDCDWTASTESSFFALCDSARRSIEALRLPWRLSSTIRLHQLSGKVPPVDKGVLMVYNTGNFNDPDAANSIISVADVKPYLRHLDGYALHLDVAYPTYSWQLLFRRRQFIGLLGGLDLNDTSRFVRTGENVYAARRDIPYSDRVIRAGDMVRAETSPYTDISAVKALIEERLAGRPHSNILYHLDSDNLSKYTPDEIDDILSSRR